MDKKIKDLIALKKLTDEEILKRLSVESSATDSEEPNEDADESDVEEESHEEETDAEEEAAEEEQPEKDLKSQIREIMAEEMAELRRGKKPPKVVKKVKTPEKTVVYNYNQEFGAI